MSVAAWFKPPRQLVTLFLVAALVSTAAIGWLAWQLLARDRNEAMQRAAEDRERMADAAVVALDHTLAALDRSLSADSIAADRDATLPAGTTIVTFQPNEFRVEPTNGLRDRTPGESSLRRVPLQPPSSRNWPGIFRPLLTRTPCYRRAAIPVCGHCARGAWSCETQAAGVVVSGPHLRRARVLPEYKRSWDARRAGRAFRAGQGL